MEQVENTIFQITPIYPKGTIEKEYESYYKEITNSTQNFSSTQLQEYLYNKVLKSSKEHDEVALGLLYSILTNPGSCSTILQTLTIITKDFLGSFINAAAHLVFEHYTRMSDVCKEQIFWLLNELLIGNVANAGHLLIALLRCVSVGDFSLSNMWTIKKIFYVVNKHRQYLLANSNVFHPVIYFFMNSLPSQLQVPEMASFVDEETEFLLTMIDSNFGECVRIGKDFVRILCELSKYEAFQGIWNQIINDPQLFNSTTNQPAIIQFLNARTSRRLISIGIPYEIEKKLVFITSQVRQRHQHYYSEWLQIQHLEGRESAELIPSMIRFICCVIHPSNEIIKSDIVQRWALIGQLLFISKENKRVSETGRYALFFDWLFFDHQPTTIMNLEPAILLIYNSFETHPLVSISLIEFICKATEECLPEYRGLIKANVNGALSMVLEMKAIPSLVPLMEFLAKYPQTSSLFEKTFSTVTAAYDSKAAVSGSNRVPQDPTPSTNGQITKRSAEKRPLSAVDNNIPYKASASRNSSESFSPTNSYTLPRDSVHANLNLVSNIKHGGKRHVGSKAVVETISGYTYALTHNHIPQSECGFDNLVEFTRIENADVRKNLTHLRSSSALSSELIAAVDSIFQYASGLKPNSDPLRDLSCCIAYSRASDLSPSLTFSDVSMLFHIFSYFVPNSADTPLEEHLEFMLTQWRHIDCRINYAFMYYLGAKKHSLKCYYNLVKNKEKIIKSDIKTCYDHDLCVVDSVVIFVLHEMPKLILNDTKMCEYLIKVMDPQNCSSILTILTKHQFNSGLRLDNATMVFLLKNSNQWDVFTEEMFFFLLRSFRFQFDVDLLSQYLEDINHDVTHHLLHHLANGSPNLKLFSKTLMKNFNESYKFIITQWLLRFPSMMVAVICQWLFNNTHQLQSICLLFSYLFEHNENDSIKAKLKSDQSFTKIHQFVASNHDNLTDKKLKERTKTALEMVEKVSDANSRKKKAPTPSSTNNSTTESQTSS